MTVCEDEGLRKKDGSLGSCLGSYVMGKLPQLIVLTIQELSGKRVKGIEGSVRGLSYVGRMR